MDENGAVTGRDKPIEYWSTPMLKGRLVELLDELEYRPFGKRPKLSDLAGWVLHDLPDDVRGDVRAEEAMAIARFWWSTSAAASDVARSVREL
jgi:hypothetical protein